jgi:hypothetical protein
MNETFRLQKKIKYQGIACTGFFAAVLMGYSSFFFLEDPAKHGFKGEHAAVAIGGFGVAVFGAMLLMSMYLWTAYYVERFTINGTMLSIRSMLQNRQFDASELQALEWRSYPAGGAILFRVLGSKARLDLHGYSEDDRLRIIRVLRDLVPSHVQQGWPMFCQKVALPLRDGEAWTMRQEPTAQFCTITRQRYDRMLLVALPLSLALTAWLGWRLGLWQFAALPVVVVAAWLLLRFNTPVAGRTVTRLTSTAHGRGSIIGWGGVVISQVLMIGLRLLGAEKSTACWAALAVLLATFPPMLYLLHQGDKRRRDADLQASEWTDAQWRGGEAAGSGQL